MKPVLIPAKVEVALLAVSWFDKVVEPVTERLAPTVAEPPALMFWLVVMNPVLVMPVWVEVPDTVNCVPIVTFPPTVRLPASLIYVATTPGKVDVPVTPSVPNTESLNPGEEVPIPKSLELVITVFKFPEVS